jgi:CHAD domain-containing protein
MGFGLKRDSAMPAALTRAVRKEFDQALQELEGARPSEEQVHTARKGVKKIRAVLRLFDSVERDARRAQEALRRAAHGLSSLRDADVAGETLAGLHARYPQVATKAVVGIVAQGLSGGNRAARRVAGSDASRAHGVLERSRRPTLSLLRDTGRFPLVRDGLTRGYRRARKVMRSISMDSDATQFHRWRRRIKEHWYHVRLFETLDRGPRGRARRLRALETWLGDDHDLALLRAAIVAAPRKFRRARAATIVLGCITRAQSRLRTLALAHGRRLFSDNPRKMRSAVTRWWRAARAARP